MVITDKFVYIHKPKTGGTFVTDALLKLYDGKWNLYHHAKLAVMKKVNYENDLGKLLLTANKHGGCRDIPALFNGRTIVSTIRNPFDYYVSQYEFGWWKRRYWHNHYKKIPGFEKFNASFPNLTFGQFMELMTAVFNPIPHQNFKDVDALGRNTIEFINDFFYEPKVVIKNLNIDYLKGDGFCKDMYPVKYIFTHGLNVQFYNFLLAQGYPEKRIQFITTKERVLPQGKGRTKEQKWERYYTPELKAVVRKKDWFLFEMFPEFDEVTF